MFGFHPLFDVAIATVSGPVLLKLDFGVSVEIVAEVLQEGHFFLKLSFCRVIIHFVRCDSVSFIALLLFNVFEAFPIAIDNDLGGVVEVDTCGTV